MEGLEAIGLYAATELDLSGDGGPPQRMRGNVATSGTFRTLRVEPALGRVLTPADESRGAEPVVVLAWDVWQTRFGADPDALGRTIRVNGTPRTVVGVMPPRFHFSSDARAWIPLLPEPDGSLPPLEAIGRLEAGATVDGVHARARALTEALGEAGEEISLAGGLEAQPWRYRMIAREHRAMLAAMVLLVSFVLLIACADVANLLLARALARTGDTAVRVAIGASRWRIVRGHVIEALVLATLGGVLGVGLAAAAVMAFERGMAGTLAYWMDFRLDLAVVLFSALLVVVAALATGLLPAVQSGRVDVLPALQGGGRGASVTGSGARAGRS